MAAKQAVRVFCGIFALAVSMLGSVQPARAEQIDDIPNPRQRDGTWVADVANRLRAQTINQVNQLAGALERDTSAELAVVVVRSLDGAPIDEFAVKLFGKWKIGKKGKDTGLLFLWAADDRRVRVEVGYGLEGSLPDGRVGAILDHYVLPRFKASDFDGGVLEGVKALAAVVRNEPLRLPPPASAAYEPSFDTFPYLLGLVGLVPASLGGLVGYRKWRRYRRRTCPGCGAGMVRLSETADDEFLERVKRLEETLHSVDYDVWKCPSCPHHFVLRYPRWFSKYGKCPQCRNRTKSRTEQTIYPATTSATGLAQITERCEFCTYHRTYSRTIPCVSESSSNGSSSSGSSSFGGGSSGGGGASRSY
jgi:uncharacterized protein